MIERGSKIPCTVPVNSDLLHLKAIANLKELPQTFNINTGTQNDVLASFVRLEIPVVEREACP